MPGFLAPLITISGGQRRCDKNVERRRHPLNKEKGTCVLQSRLCLTPNGSCQIFLPTEADCKERKPQPRGLLRDQDEERNDQEVEQRAPRVCLSGTERSRCSFAWGMRTPPGPLRPPLRRQGSRATSEAREAKHQGFNPRVAKPMLRRLKVDLCAKDDEKHVVCERPRARVLGDGVLAVVRTQERS
jgi:hypothetical protein